MINIHDIQLAYNELYRCIREYIWDIKTVEKLAELEIAVYQTCPDIYEIRKQFSLLRIETREIEDEDEDLHAAYEDMSELILSSDETYVKLYKVDTEVE